jgi:hypothetical protein
MLENALVRILEDTGDNNIGPNSKRNILPKRKQSQKFSSEYNITFYIKR